MFGDPKTCPFCGNKRVECPECGQTYFHGQTSHCRKTECKRVNAPVDCVGCGRVVAHCIKGVLDFDRELKPYEE